MTYNHDVSQDTVLRLWLHKDHNKPNETPVLHPDGKPWKKCCGCKLKKKRSRFKDGTDFCAFRRNYEDNIARIGKTNAQHSGRADDPFVCPHQLDEGFFRVCAGWHCCYKAD